MLNFSWTEDSSPAGALIAWDMFPIIQDASRSERVLVVDDNVNYAENLAEILQLDGYVTEVAASAEEAVSMAEVHAPTILITDFMLPGANGAKLVEGIRRTHPGVIAVVISGHSDERTTVATHDSGAAFLPKPVDLGRLRRMIVRRLGSA